MAVHRKSDVKPKEKPAEPVVVSDVITETIEVIEEVTPQAAEAEKPVGSPESTDPLSDFKEKLKEEEKEEMQVGSNGDSGRKNYMWPILFIFIVAILLLIGIFLYKRGASINSGDTSKVTPTTAATVTPEPTKAVDLTKYEIEVLNGGGVAGEASRQKESLTAEGFTISSIGNAVNSDYTDTIIKAKAEVEKDFIAKLKDSLSNSFTVGETETLSDDSSVPVVVIIGTKK